MGESTSYDLLGRWSCKDGAFCAVAGAHSLLAAQSYVSWTLQIAGDSKWDL